MLSLDWDMQAPRSARPNRPPMNWSGRRAHQNSKPCRCCQRRVLSFTTHHHPHVRSLTAGFHRSLDTEAIVLETNRRACDHAVALMIWRYRHLDLRSHQHGTAINSGA
jgi:hypothetical protein